MARQISVAAVVFADENAVCGGAAAVADQRASSPRLSTHSQLRFGTKHVVLK